MTTFVLRPRDPPTPCTLRRVGPVVVTVGEILAVMGSGVPWRIVYLTPTKEEVRK